ncbi:MAG: hypothetical protein OQK03_13190, partial [Colwellia sp.]|nr:hypothetical protein [Colwellia sp.]
VMKVFDRQLLNFTEQWQRADKFDQARDAVISHGENLWRDAKQQIAEANSFDDRPLFWARLKFSKAIRTLDPRFKLSAVERESLLHLLEESSRGRTDLTYRTNSNKRILITGFDPFLLDRHIDQSNPSGVAAMLLDGQVISYKGITAEINTVMVPVRYIDFDQGIIEDLLAPYYALNNVDMIITISMGRKDFDLEHFPGKRRSVTFPDNLNVSSGGDKTSPIISKLNKELLPGAEFVEFSLPYQAMQKAKGDYKINDNRKVVTLAKAMEPNSLTELAGKIAVSGSGGGYLSNEISYRSIRLRDQLNSSIPTGHIHTPRIKQFEPEIEKKIVEQIKGMLQQSLSDI